MPTLEPEAMQPRRITAAAEIDAALAPLENIGEQAIVLGHMLGRLFLALEPEKRYLLANVIGEAIERGRTPV